MAHAIHAIAFYLRLGRKAAADDNASMFHALYLQPDASHEKVCTLGSWFDNTRTVARDKTIGRPHTKIPYRQNCKQKERSVVYPVASSSQSTKTEFEKCCMVQFSHICMHIDNISSPFRLIKHGNRVWTNYLCPNHFACLFPLFHNSIETMVRDHECSERFLHAH